MDGKRFDALTRGNGTQTNRRGFFKGLAATVAAIVGVRMSEGDANAAGVARITIHNATCPSLLGGRTIYNACHANGFGCVNFTFRGRTIRTNPNGVASASIGAGSFTISQQTSRVSRSSSIYVYCSHQKNGQILRVLYDGVAPGGVATMTVKAGENVICDWYNITTVNLAMPGQCPQATTTRRPTTTSTTSTTPNPGTTTTTTTIPGVYTCADFLDCPDPWHTCTNGFCVCSTGYHTCTCDHCTSICLQDGFSCCTDQECDQFNAPACVNNACTNEFICSDSIKNGDETDVDCGGQKCPACPNGKTCAVNADCTSNYCYGFVCSVGPTSTTSTTTVDPGTTTTTSTTPS